MDIQLIIFRAIQRLGIGWQKNPLAANTQLSIRAVVLISAASPARTQQGHASTFDQHHHLVVGENCFLLALYISTTEPQIVLLGDQECLQTNKWSSINRVIGCKLPVTSIDSLNSPYSTTQVNNKPL